MEAPCTSSPPTARTNPLPGLITLRVDTRMARERAADSTHLAGVLEDANRAACELLEAHSAAQLRGQPFARFVGSPVPFALARRFGGASPQAEGEFEIDLLGLFGARRSLSATALALDVSPENASRSLLVILRPRRAPGARAPQRLAETLAHDLRSPLMAVGGFAQILVRRHADGLDPEARLCAEQILSATERLERMLEGLTHYARLERHELEPGAVDLARLLHSLVRAGEPAGVELELDPDLAPVRGEPALLERAFDALLDNALRFGRPNEPLRVRIVARQREHGARVSVHDNGRGIPREQHERVFGLFQRLHPAEVGVGMGLTLARRTIELHGGAIWLDSVEGQGSTFHVELPAHAGP